MNTKGFFISLEGIDGSGKTSLKGRLISKLEPYGVVGIREPGGTAISEKIRDLLLDTCNQGMAARTEAMLYAAARSQLLEEIIRPVLHEGGIVLADRFMDSTVAYQGYGRGMDLEFLKNLNRICTGGIIPQLTLLLDLDPLEGMRRRGGTTPDRLEREGLQFQERVRRGYLDMAREEPERIRVIDAGQPIDRVLEEAWNHIRILLPNF